MKFVGDFISSAIVSVALIAVAFAIGWIIMEILF